jgi:hypothetical protein
MLSGKRPKLINISRIEPDDVILAYNGKTFMTPDEVKNNLNRWAYRKRK